MKTGAEDKSLIALAGEYHVLAQLAERGIVGALTLGHTKGIDILAHNPRTGRMRRVEVKSTRRKPAPSYLWHPDPEGAHAWTMSAKHEAISDRSLIFCFVWLSGAMIQPKIFVVPAIEVAKYRVRLSMAPTSQTLEPPAIPGRFSLPMSPRLKVSSRGDR